MSSLAIRPGISSTLPKPPQQKYKDLQIDGVGKYCKIDPANLTRDPAIEEALPENDQKSIKTDPFVKTWLEGVRKEIHKFFPPGSLVLPGEMPEGRIPAIKGLEEIPPGAFFSWS